MVSSKTIALIGTKTLTSLLTSTSSITATPTPADEEDCTLNNVLQISLGVVSVLLALSETMALTRFFSCTGIIEVFVGCLRKPAAPPPTSPRPPSDQASFRTAPESGK